MDKVGKSIEKSPLDLLMQTMQPLDQEKEGVTPFEQLMQMFTTNVEDLQDIVPVEPSVDNMPDKEKETDALFVVESPVIEESSEVDQLLMVLSQMAAAMQTPALKENQSKDEPKPLDTASVMNIELTSSDQKPKTYNSAVNVLQDLKEFQQLKEVLKALVAEVSNPGGDELKQAEPTVQGEAMVLEPKQTVIKVEVNDTDVGQEVTKQLQEFVGNKTVNSKHVELVINPRHLGEVHLQMTRTENGIEIKVHLSNTEVKEQVEHLMNEARRDLSDKGVNIEVQVYEQQESENQKRKEEPEPEQKIIEEEASDDSLFVELFENEIGV